MALFKKSYQISGREREELQTVQRQIIGLNGQLVALLQFIAKRENLDLSTMEFNPDTLTFSHKKPAPPTA